MGKMGKKAFRQRFWHGSRLAGLAVLALVLASCGQARQTGTEIGTGIVRSQNQPKEAEAQINLRAMLRGQQAYFMENGRFTESLATLGLGLPQETQDYRYEISLDNSPSNDKVVIVRAIAQNDTLRSQAAAIAMTASGNPSEVMCQSQTPSKSIRDPKLINGEVQCGRDSEPI